ncbi:trehalose-phosphatase [Dongia sp.]|uniref:trehalose-phosphatase n=1 Tax=Dongia sp. TaxID=1977262 RepID=UPI0035AFA764
MSAPTSLVDPHVFAMNNPDMIIERDISDPPLPDNVATGDWALFLDLDGTLLDLAPTPDSVIVPKDLIETLAALHTRLDGALAIVSGRSLSTIDAFLQPLRLAAAGEHGAVLRYADGSFGGAGASAAVPVLWRAKIRDAARNWPGALVEEKPHGIAVHFRANPKLETEITTALADLTAADPAFEVLPAAMARELRHRGAHKGAALRHLMQTSPFAGRRPLFIGDDVTDEDAITAAQALNGIGLRVPEHFAGQPTLVRAWLRHLSGKE